MPKKLLVCVAVGEPGKVDVRLAERLAWRLGAEATILTVLPEEGEVPEHVTRFLEASARAMSARGVPTRTLVRHGHPVSEIVQEVSVGQHDLVIVGAPLPSSGRALAARGDIVGTLLRTRPTAPILIVQSQG
jgi:hypothetical protein